MDTFAADCVQLLAADMLLTQKEASVALGGATCSTWDGFGFSFAEEKKKWEKGLKEKWMPVWTVF